MNAVRDLARAHFEAVGQTFLDYDPLLGSFTYRHPPACSFGSPRDCKAWLGKYAGKSAGSPNAAGYLMLGIQKRRVLAHHYAFFLVHGRWPVGQVDHLNGDRTDNRAANLREVDASGNRMNQRRRSDNSSGHTGIFFDSRKKRWIASICVRGRRTSLGSFHGLSEAIRVRREAQSELGFGPNHGACR